MSFGERIKKLRTDKGFTQKELADQLFVTPQALSRWENGSTEPPLDTISKMADIFGVTMDQMMGKESVPTSVESVPTVVPKEETIKIEEKAAVPLASCERCNKLIYEESDLHHFETTERHRIGRTTHRETIDHVLCSSCEAKRNEEIRQNVLNQTDEKVKRGKKFRIWSYIVGAVFGALLGFVVGYVCRYDPTSAVYPWEVCLPISIVSGILGFALAGCFVLGNTFVPEFFVSMIKFGFKLPFGIIFDDLFDVIIFKIIMFILGILLGIFTLVLAIAFCGSLAAFVYPYAISKSYKHPEECW